MIEIWKGKTYINTVENNDQLRCWIINNVAPLREDQLRTRENINQYEAEYIAQKRGLTFKTIKQPKNNDKQTL